MYNLFVGAYPILQLYRKKHNHSPTYHNLTHLLSLHFYPLKIKVPCFIDVLQFYDKF